MNESVVEQTLRERLQRPPDHAVDGETEYKMGWSFRVPYEPGVYLISDLRGPLYIGRSLSLRRRFEEHYWESHNDLLQLALRNPMPPVRFAWWMSSPSDQSELEKLLIRSLRPLCNKVTYANE